MLKQTEIPTFRCRNVRCKQWLKLPVENPRDAFCCEKCAESFYRGRCRVCERPIVSKNSRRELCDSDRCRYQFRRFREQFFRTWYPNPLLTSKAEKSSIKSTVKTGIKSDRAWSKVAGPEVSVNLRIPLDLDLARRIANANSPHWEQAALIQRNDAPINVVGGYRFPAAKSVELKPTTSKTTVRSATKAEAELIATIPADLSIPAFLRRAPS